MEALVFQTFVVPFLFLIYSLINHIVTIIIIMFTSMLYVLNGPVSFNKNLIDYSIHESNSAGDEQATETHGSENLVAGYTYVCNNHTS